MTTIYEEAKHRLEGEINKLETQLEMCKGLSRAAALSKLIRDHKTTLTTLEQDFSSSNPSEVDYREKFLGGSYTKGDIDDENVIMCLTELTHA